MATYTLPYQNPAYFILFFLTYVSIKTIYRLYFHPLVRFPGPKLGAATSLWNAYHDVLQSGLVKRLPELHKKYGPIIRIQPNELHIADLEGYNQIFRVGTPYDRIWHNAPFLTGSLQSLEKLSETKKRKEFLSPFFSKNAITRVEPVLHRQKLVQFLDTLQNATTTTAPKTGNLQPKGPNNAVIDFFLGFRCLTSDLIMDYCFQSDLNSLGEPGFNSETVEAFIQGFDLAIASTYFPNLFAVLNFIIMSLPEGFRRKNFAAVYGFETMQRLSRERVDALLRGSRSQTGDGKEKKKKVPTMFDAMIGADAERGQVTPSRHDMIADGCLMIAAGTDTTANVLGVLLWHVTQDPEVERKLLAELKRGIPVRDGLLDSATLEGEGFEYMRAVVKEALRLSYGVPGRIIRKVPAEGAKFGDTFVPGNTVVTSCTYLQNSDPKTYPDPMRFDPERWLCDPETLKTREKQMLSFSRGSRSCIGINLAYATLHLTVAHLFRRFEIRTTGYTTEQDMEWKDKFLPVPNGRIKGLVKIRDQ